MAKYLAHSDRYPVLSMVSPIGKMESKSASAPAEGPASWDAKLAVFEQTVFLGITRWSHPRVFARSGHQTLQGARHLIPRRLLQLAASGESRQRGKAYDPTCRTRSCCGRRTPSKCLGQRTLRRLVRCKRR